MLPINPARAGIIHIVKPTADGAECLCADDGVLAIHPDKLNDHDTEAICPKCRAIHEERHMLNPPPAD